MPSISLSELKQNAAKKRSEMDAQLESLGYKRVGDRYLRIPTQADSESDALDLEKKGLETEKLRRELSGEDVGKETDAQRSQRTRFNTVNEVVSQIEELSKKVNKSNNRGSQALKILTGRILQTDVDAAELDSKKGYLSQIVRTLGESGALAEGDIQRAISAIPTITDTKAVAERKTKALKDILKAAQKGVDKPKDDIDNFLDGL